MSRPRGIGQHYIERKDLLVEKIKSGYSIKMAAQFARVSSRGLEDVLQEAARMLQSYEREGGCLPDICIFYLDIYEAVAARDWKYINEPKRRAKGDPIMAMNIEDVRRARRMAAEFGAKAQVEVSGTVEIQYRIVGGEQWQDGQDRLRATNLPMIESGDIIDSNYREDEE